MYSLEVIEQLNRGLAKNSYRPVHCKDPMTVKVPYVGSEDVKGLELVDCIFVDSSGCGTPGEAALTQNQFRDRMKKGLYYGIIEQGEFQCWVGEWKRKRK